jgi:hypothetical protein
MVRRNKKRDERAPRDRDRRYSVRGIRRDPLDIEKFSKALLGLVLADNERQAQADHAAQGTGSASAPDRDEQPDGGAPDA